MNDIKQQVESAFAKKEIAVSARVTDMTQYNMGVEIEIFSNGERGYTVKTLHKESDGIESIVKAHCLAREPKTQRKNRNTEKRVYRETLGN